LGPQTRRENRIYVDAGKMETLAANRCGMGLAAVAQRARRLHVCPGALGL